MTGTDVTPLSGTDTTLPAGAGYAVGLPDTAALGSVTGPALGRRFARFAA